MSKKLVKNKIIVLFILLFLILFMSIYNYNKSYATIEFEQKNINVPGYARFCEIFFASNGEYIHNEEYILPTPYSLFHKIKIKIKDIHINQIRLDPLREDGEIFIKNFTITQYDGFKKIKQKINFKHINSKLMHNIKIKKQTYDKLHLQSVGKDPYFVLTSNLQLTYNFINYFTILFSVLYSLLISLLLIYSYKSILNNFYTINDVFTLFTLTLYSISTLFFGKYVTLSHQILLFIPFLSFILIIHNGILSYKDYYKNIFVIIFGLTLLTLLSDYLHNSQYIYRFIEYLPTIIASLSIPIIFIHKKNFNKKLYQHLLVILLSTFSIIAILLHYNIINISHIIIFKYRMTESTWAQKNYTFWYLFLMWGTISLFNLKSTKQTNLYVILYIILISAFAIMSGYSVSAKLAFIVSLIIYILFILFKPQFKILMFIPAFLALYLMLTPFIAEIFASLSYIHPRLAGREAIYGVYSHLIYKHFFFGYGFNSCISLIPSDYLSENIINKYNHTRFVNICSPHTLPLVLWLNFGLVGAIFFSTLIYQGTKQLIYKTYQQHNQPALFALIVSFLIITSFSWGAWYAHTLLTYSFFISIILLSLNTNKVFK